MKSGSLLVLAALGLALGLVVSEVAPVSSASQASAVCFSAANADAAGRFACVSESCWQQSTQRWVDARFCGNGAMNCWTLYGPDCFRLCFEWAVAAPVAKAADAVEVQ